MHTFNNYYWLIARTEQCSNSVLGEAHSNTIKDWHGKAANAFNEEMFNVAKKACEIGSINSKINLWR
ncbi:hypothetical protein HMPREF1573_00027 [Gardnerella vaginalis JCP7276]|nr:hypothetical protein HMPREF1573_00027 [Gardnerella vaginalis JCP7276]